VASKESRTFSRRNLKRIKVDGTAVAEDIRDAIIPTWKENWNFCNFLT
jgi:hypothetical protein